MKWLKAHWPAISAVLGGAATFLLPAVKAFVAANPKSTVGVLLSAVIGAYYAQSPLTKGN